MPRFAGWFRKVDWSRLMLELVVVVAGVFIALALDAWVAARKDRSEEALLLRAVRSEFHRAVIDMDRELVFRRAMTANTDQFFRMAENGTRPDPATMDRMLGALLYWSDARFSMGAVESILVGGKLHLIENEEIRYFLAALPERLADVKQVETNDYTTLFDTAVPYLATHGDMPQILATMGNRPGDPEPGEPWLDYSPRNPRNHVPLIEEPEFLALVAGTFASQANVTYAYEGLRPDLVKMITLLDEELGDTAVPGPQAASDELEFAVRYAAAWSSGDPESVGAFHAEDGSLTINGGAPSVGRPAIVETVRAFMTAYPDMSVEIEKLERIGDAYRFHWRFTGTASGPGGTGRTVRISGYEDWTLGADGLITRSLGYYDQADWDRQAGKVASKETS
ncbi:MAG TPA: nuclear transport factor 2 family protein [Steroidobacteraceae bacterium]|nr:nuclear transport factor 2 family protein [Steroidobacteraceae bacterium]